MTIINSPMSIADLEFDASEAMAVGPRPNRRNGHPKSEACVPAVVSSSVSLSSASTSPAPPVASREPLYLDIETIPDYSRLPLFGLPDLPEIRQETPADKCGEPSEAINQSVPNFATELRDLWPCDAFLDACIVAEKGGKNRDGILKEIESFRRERQKNRDAKEDRRKLLSTTPEYCRIVAAAFAVGSGEIQSTVLVSGTCGKVPGSPVASVVDDHERSLLKSVWAAVRDSSPVVGFGIAGFDLPVLLTRSIVLGVECPSLVNRSAFRDDVIDLHSARFAGSFGKSLGLKPLARCLGIDVPAGDCDGSQVERMLSENPSGLRKYVESDVHVARELHRKYRGYFCK